MADYKYERFLNEDAKRANRESKRISWLPIALMVILVVILIGIWYQFKEEKRFAVVNFYGKGSAINLSKNYNLTQFYSTKKNKGSVLAEKGDLLGFNTILIPFDKVKEDSLLIDDSGDSLVFVNGKINSLIISDKADLLPWFDKMKDSDLSDLKTICFQSKIPESYIPYLKKIANQKPNTALIIEENDSVNILESYFKKAAFFKPRFVSVFLSQKQFPLLKHFEMVKHLYLVVPDSVITTPLPNMSYLKQCIVYGDNIKAIHPSFLTNNKQVEKLGLFACLTDYTFLQQLVNLKQLSINNFDCEGNLEKIANLQDKFPELSVLIFSGVYSKIDRLLEYKKLKWLGLPKNTTQKQFDSITTQLTDLQVLEFQGSNLIKNWAGLQKLPRLKGLIITDTLTDKASLYKLNEIRYLSVPQKNKKDSTNVLALEKALPGCLIVPNRGACLGSGWLLLLIPLTIMFSVIFNRKVLKRSLKKKRTL